MADPASPTGPPVPDEDRLWRVIPVLAAASWFPNNTLSSAAFAFPVFSTDIERLTTVAEALARWPSGSGVVAFGCGSARGLGFDARHEPELGNPAHANVYSTFSTNERKRRARTLATECVVLQAPTPPAS